MSNGRPPRLRIKPASAARTSRFGENWPALDECLADLSWLPGLAYCVIVTNADLLVSGSKSEGRFATLLKILNKIVLEWSLPVQAGEHWDRDAVPFHCVMQTDDGHERSLSATIEAAGWQVGRLASNR
jgi:hypothetical protein